MAIRLVAFTALILSVSAKDSVAQAKEDAMQSKMEGMMTAEAASLKASLQAHLSPIMTNKKQEDEQKQNLRVQRWQTIINRQQQALVEEQSKINAESKELDRMKREKEWQKVTEQEKKIEAEKQEAEALKTEVEKECASVKSSVQAFIVASQDQAHATCLKGQLGACATSENHDAVVVQECKESSAGWQKKCLADRATEMSACAPAGADWAALRRGQKGIEADNSALQGLSDWCTFNNLLAKVNEKKDKTPYALILNKKAAVSKDVMSKVGEYAETFASQPWDLVKVDDNTQSVIVRTENADKIRQAMLTMKAKPLEMLPQALMEVGVDVKDWTAGITGMSPTPEACGLQAPAFQ
jgi:hypothetical protein